LALRRRRQTRRIQSADRHFGCSVHWELRDIETERLLASSDIPEPCGQIPEPPKVNIPKWVSGRHLGSSSNPFSVRAPCPRYRLHVS
jgi:hypothetical protein